MRSAEAHHAHDSGAVAMIVRSAAQETRLRGDDSAIIICCTATEVQQ
jgi:hypothetical protein